MFCVGHENRQFKVPHQTDGNVSSNVVRSVCYGLGYGLWRAFMTTVSNIVSRFL